MAFLSEFIPHLLGRPTVCLQDFNGYHSTFPMSFWNKTGGVRRSRDPRELVFNTQKKKRKRECVSYYLALSPLSDLKFLSCLDGVLLRFTREHVLANVDADPLLTC